MKIRDILEEKKEIFITQAVADEGYDLAEKLQNASRKYDWANEKDVNINSLRSKGKKFIPGTSPRVKIRDAMLDSKKEYDKASKEYTEVQTIAQKFEKTNGINVVKCWEAKSGRSWPYYKMRSGNDASEPKITIKR